MTLAGGAPMSVAATPNDPESARFPGGGDGGGGGGGRAGAPSPPRAKWKVRLRALLLLALVGVLLSAPWWGRRALASLAFFRVRRVEIEGVRYLAPRDVVARLRVDTTKSVWDDPAVLERRLVDHPLVESVNVGRRLPGTLVVRVVERPPVALVPARGSARGMRAVDATGRELPIDPSRAVVDVPVLARRDSALVRLLGELRDREPVLFSRVSELRRAGKGELVLRLTTSVPVRATVDVSTARLAEIQPVESDLARRGMRAAELDLRYRDQVIVRLQ